MPTISSGRPDAGGQLAGVLGEQPGHLGADDAAAEHGDAQRCGTHGAVMTHGAIMPGAPTW